MAFEMQVVSHAPLTSERDPRRAARLFFAMIGYTSKKGPDHGISFRLFYECFLLHPERAWTVEELAMQCETTMPSIYRHLNKLKDLDLIEDLYVGDGDDRKRGFRLRYGDLSKAWTFAEAHFQMAIDNYRKTVDHIETLLQDARDEVTTEQPGADAEGGEATNGTGASGNGANGGAANGNGAGAKASADVKLNA